MAKQTNQSPSIVNNFGGQLWNVFVNKDCDVTMLAILGKRERGGTTRAGRSGATLEEREGRGDACERRGGATLEERERGGATRARENSPHLSHPNKTAAQPPHVPTLCSTPSILAHEHKRTHPAHEHKRKHTQERTKKQLLEMTG